MAAQAGRGFLVQMDISGTDTTIAGSTSGSIAIGNEIVDITSKDNNAFRTLLPGAGAKAATVQLQGFNLDDSTIGAVRTAHLAGTAKDFTIVVPGTSGGSAGSYSFTGVISNMEESGEEGGALSYNVTIESSGEITFTDLT